MSFWILIQVIFDFVALAGFVAVWVKLNRPAKDDPRLSRGLQLLQTKISVLEDLSDRTETQVSQLTALMEHKVKEIQQQILNADKHVQMVEASISKSMEVAKIFQDRIPHQEIVERKNTIKYVKAARMAHQGATVDEISQQVDLSRGEIEFIAKVNKNQLQFSEEDLPEWIQKETSENNQNKQTISEYDFIESQEGPVPAVQPAVPASEITQQPLMKKEDRITLSDLGDRFRQAMTPIQAAQIFVPTTINAQEASPMIAEKKIDKKPEQQVVEGQNAKGEKIQVRKVVFRRVDSSSDLS